MNARNYRKKEHVYTSFVHCTEYDPCLQLHQSSFQIWTKTVFVLFHLLSCAIEKRIIRSYDASFVWKTLSAEYCYTIRAWVCIGKDNNDTWSIRLPREMNCFHYTISSSHAGPQIARDVKWNGNIFSCASVLLLIKFNILLIGLTIDMSLLIFEIVSL